MISGIIYVIRPGWQWADTPSGDGLKKTLYNRFMRRSLLGLSDCMAQVAEVGP